MQHVTYVYRQASCKMYKQDRNFTVVISATEYKHIGNWVLKHENLETGGDLFGLWLDKRTAVIQLVLGPGKGCRRTGTSFYQDVQYLSNVGSHLTQREGLCHIGEWHSHHKLGLARPSGGDENTVWSNMPNGFSRFVLFIANIESTGEGNAVNVGCFLFEVDPQINRQFPVLRGNFQLLPDHSPFRSKSIIDRKVQEKAESLNKDIHHLEIRKSRKDFLVVKPRRVAEKSGTKKISVQTSSQVEGDKEKGGKIEEPRSRRTPDNLGRPNKEKGETKADESRMQRNESSQDDAPNERKDSDKKRSPTPDNSDKVTLVENRECIVLVKGGGTSNKKRPKKEDKEKGQEENRNRQAVSRIEVKSTKPVPPENCHDKKKPHSEEPRVAEGGGSPPCNAVLTRDPETPSGSVQVVVQDDDRSIARSGCLSCFRSNRKTK